MMKNDIVIDPDFIEKAYLIAEEVIESLSLHPGSYGALDIHNLLRHQHKHYVADNQNDPTAERCTVTTSSGSVSIPKSNIFYCISKLESLEKLQEKKRKIWTINETRECRSEYHISMPREKTMKYFSSTVKGLRNGMGNMTFSLRNQSLYYVENPLTDYVERSNTARITNKDFDTFKDYTQSLPDMFFNVTWSDLRKIYGKCRVQLYYDGLTECAYQNARLVITNDDGIMISSTQQLLPKEIKVLMKYVSSLSQPYDEDREVRWDTTVTGINEYVASTSYPSIIH